MFNKIPTAGSPVYGNMLAALFLPFFTSAMDLCQRLAKTDACVFLCATYYSRSLDATLWRGVWWHCGEGWGGTVARGGVALWRGEGWCSQCMFSWLSTILGLILLSSWSGMPQISCRMQVNVFLECHVPSSLSQASLVWSTFDFDQSNSWTVLSVIQCFLFDWIDKHVYMALCTHLYTST